MQRPSLRQVLTCIAAWLYSIYWESKRYGFFSHIGRIIRFVLVAVFPLVIAAQLAFRLVGSKDAPVIQWIGIGLLSTVGLGHVLSSLAQQIRRRPEVRDVFGIRQLNYKLEELMKGIYTLDKTEVVYRRAGQFINDVVKISCIALCNERNLRGTLMIYTPESNILTVEGIWPPSSDVDATFQIRLLKKSKTELVPEASKGMAGLVFANDRVAYLPNRYFRASWYIDYNLVGETEAVRLGDVWKESQSKRFSCVLSAPIYIDVEGESTGLGVLNLESKSRDSFGDADFHLMAITANTIARGLTAVSDRIRKLSGKKTP